VIWIGAWENKFMVTCVMLGLWLLCIIEVAR
jgi:hypothetical protein